jgi:hypothetical protein
MELSKTQRLQSEREEFQREVLTRLAEHGEALRRIDERITDVSTNGLRICAEHKADLVNIKQQEKALWSAVNGLRRVPRQQATIWGAGGVGVGGALLVLLEWLQKHNGGTP